MSDRIATEPQGELGIPTEPERERNLTRRVKTRIEMARTKNGLERKKRCLVAPIKDEKQKRSYYMSSYGK